jgi:PTS system mannose-specific IIA component
MVGLVLVTHGNLGAELCRCMEGILGKQEGIKTISVDFNTSVDAARSDIAEAIQEVDKGGGVILMTDMFGGTPSNIGLSFLDSLETPIEVMTGVNLPMLIKGATMRKDCTLLELCGKLEESGKRGIIVASELLKEQQKQTH